MSQKNGKYTMLKVFAVIGIALMAVFILTGGYKKTTKYVPSANSSIQSGQEGTFSNQLLPHEIQLQMIETVKGIGAYEEADDSGQYAVAVILLLMLLSQCTGAGTYLTASGLLENQNILRILRFIQEIDGKKERTSYCIA